MPKENEIRLSIEIDKDLKRKAKSKAYADGTNLKEKIVDLIKKWLGV